MKEVIKVPEYKLIQFLIVFLTFLYGWTFLSILGNIASLWMPLLKQRNTINFIETETQVFLKWNNLYFGHFTNMNSHNAPVRKVN